MGRRYGTIPTLAAVDRMHDTLWRSVPSAQVEQMQNRLRNMTVEEMASTSVGDRTCGNLGTIQPSVVNGTNVNFLDGPLIRPRRPSY